MNKYYTQINVRLSSFQIQEGDDANYIRLMSKMMIERIFSEAIKNNKELRILFSYIKPKVKVYIERVDKLKNKKERKRILPKNILSERIVNLK